MGSPRPPPSPDPDLPDEEEDLGEGSLPAPAPRPAPALDPWPDEGEDLAEEDLPRGPPAPPAAPAPALPDEAGADLGGLLDDGVLRDDEEEDLAPGLPSFALPAGKVVAGVEELVELPELGGLRLPATLATAIQDSVLSAPLRLLSEGRVRVALGPANLEGDPRATRLRLRLGPHRLEILVRLVEGPSPRLVLGRDALAGRFVVDPGLRHVLDLLPVPGEPA